MKKPSFSKIAAVSLATFFLLSASVHPTTSDSPPPDVSQNEWPADITGTNFWTWSGPQYNSANNEAPQVTQIVIDPANSNIVYAGTNQGVYRSTDGGENWAPRNGGLGGYGDLVIAGLAIDPTDSQTLVIGTWGYGLLRSTDSGANWTRLADPPSATSLRASTLGAEEPPPIIAGGPSYNYQGEESRLRPQGQPITWQRTAVRRVTINPANHNEIFACIDDGYGLYRSTDGGDSWTKIDMGTGSSRTYTFAPSNNQIRYASFGSWTSGGGFYRTTNGGNVWTEVGAGTINGTVIAVAVHPTNPDIVMAGTSGDGLYRSTDSGISWTMVSDGLTDSTFFSVAFALSNPNVVYAGGYTWIYRSTDGGVTWSNADSSFPTYYIEGLAIHPTDPETVMVGANYFPRGGVYKRTSNSSPFTLKPYGMEDTFVLGIEQDPNDSNILYAATWGAGIFRSDDGGSNWNAKYVVPYVYTIEATQGPTGTILYAGTFYSDWGILKSYDRGDTWFEVSWDYPSYISFDIESIYGNPDHLIAATFNGIQYSYDGGETWYDSSGLEEGIVLRLCEFPGTGRLLATTYGGGLFYSWGGYSWYEANTGVTGTYGQYTYDVACSPNTPGLAYAGSLGIYRTTDYGEHWQPINARLPNDYFRAIDVVPGTGDVFAGSHQNGVYLAPNGVPIWSEINTGLVEQRTRSMKVVSNSPVRAFVGTNGQGAWDYTLTSRPTVSSVYLPLTLKNHLSLTCYAYEPNDGFDEAYRLSAPGTYCSYISTASDEDYYRFDVSTLGPITVDLTNIPPGTDYDIELYGNNQAQVSGSWYGSNDDEQIVFQPIQTGRYYIRVYSYSGSSQSHAYHLTVSYNGSQGTGQIYGTVTASGSAAANVPVILYYYNGYRTTQVSTLTDNSGVYRFRGMTGLPVGHYYYVYYPNYESNNQRLSYWRCQSFTGYQAGESYESCSFDIKGITLTDPPSGDTRTFPVTFQWTTRGVTNDQYQLYLRRYSPCCAYYYSSYTTGGSHTLSSLPSGFSYGDTNYWSLNISNDEGYGASYYMRSIVFSSSLNTTGEPVDEPVPTCAGPGVEKGHPCHPMPSFPSFPAP